MPLYLKDNCRPILFLHIPKTGGSTIENWLNAECNYSQMLLSKYALDGMTCTPQHLSFESISALVGEDFSTAKSYAFTVVRNPFDRLVSEFFYRVGMKQIRLGSSPEKYFSNWVNDILEKATKSPDVLDNHLRPQGFFISDDVRIFKLESGIEAILETVAKENDLAAPTVISSKKVSAKTDVIWSDSAIQRVQEFYKDDFHRFGYSVEPVNGRETKLNSVKSTMCFCRYHVRNIVMKFANGEI